MPYCSCVRYKSYFKSLHGWLGTAKERFEGWAEMSSPVGVCSTPVSLPDNKVAAEFALLSDCTRHVILGFNYLPNFGVNILRVNGKISINPSVKSIVSKIPADNTCHLLVNENLLLPSFVCRVCAKQDFRVLRDYRV